MANLSKEFIKEIKEKAKGYKPEIIAEAIQKYKQDNNPRGDIFDYRLEILTRLSETINTKFKQELISSDLDLFKREVLRIINEYLTKLLVLMELPENDPVKSEKLIESIYFRRSDYTLNKQAIIDIKIEAFNTINDLRIILGRYLQINNLDKIKHSELKLIKEKTEEIIKRLNKDREKEFLNMDLMSHIAFCTLCNFFEEKEQSYQNINELKKLPTNSETRTFNGMILADHWVMMDHLDVSKNPEYKSKLEKIKTIIDTEGVEALPLLPYMRNIIQQRKNELQSKKISIREYKETLKVILKDLKLRLKNSYEAAIQRQFLENEVLGYFTDKKNNIILLIWKDIVDPDLNIANLDTNIKSYLISPLPLSKTKMRPEDIELLKSQKLQGYTVTF